MKTVSGTFIFVVAAVVTVVAVLSFHSFAAGSHQQAVTSKKFNLRIGRTHTDYVDVKSKGDFINVLKHFRQDQIDINYFEGPGHPVEHYPPLPRIGIKTDKVTTSELAQHQLASEAVANDPNVVNTLALIAQRTSRASWTRSNK